MRGARLLLVAALVAVSFPAPAYFVHGNKFVERMREYEKCLAGDKGCDFSEAEHYMGFVTGVSDTLDDAIICEPDHTTVGQVCAVVAKYIKEHPEEWNEPALYLVTRALKQAFPCKVARK